MKTEGTPLNDGYELHLLTYIITNIFNNIKASKSDK